MTFCILTLEKAPWLERTLDSIRCFCKIDYRVKVLSQGKPDSGLVQLLQRLDNQRMELLVSDENLGCGGGRKLLASEVETPLAMMLDDDMYLTEGSINLLLELLTREQTIGAISMRSTDGHGRLLSTGGSILSIRNGVINISRPLLNPVLPWTEVQRIDGGAMLFRTEMRNCFTWDDRLGFLEDLDKSLQILRAGKWKQAIATGGRLIHDRSWVGQQPKYEKVRFNGLNLRRNYDQFRKKWGYRLDLRTHLLYEVIYPVLSLTRFPITASQADQHLRRGTILKRKRDYTQRLEMQPIQAHNST